MDRRSFIRKAASVVAGWLVGSRLVQRRALSQELTSETWGLRRVLPGDEDQLLSLMKSCVDREDSFHGLCNAVEWTSMWAETAVSDRPRSVVLTVNDMIVAYFDLPSEEPRIVGEESVDRHARAFWCGAAGVRMEVLGEEQSVQVFQELLYEAFSDAMSLGYECVRAAAPWEQHPYLRKPFKDYPGLMVKEFSDEDGVTKYLLEWRLADAVQTLAAAGAGRTLG